MVTEWAHIVIWLWGGGMIPIMALGALAKDDIEGWLTAVVALLWPVFVGWVVFECIRNNED